jgi:CheY-like chemotaxis protein
MNSRALELLPPCILVLDDEKQIHSSLRLRLGTYYQLVCLSSPHEAIALIRRQPFDLCIVDVHMPEMDGLTFIEKSREVDPALGYVVLSGFDSEENLRRAIPLQVFDFIAKPLPDQAGFEKRIPEWITRTRERRRELILAKKSETVIGDLELAHIERDVESTASESAREALLRTASLLTTTQALLLSANHSIEAIVRKDSKLATVYRGLQEAQRSAEEAATITDAYFSSAFADRDSSPALIDACLRHGIGIARRRAKADDRKLHVDLSPVGRDLAIAGLAGIDFLLLFVPALIQSLELAASDTTIQVRCEEFNRLGDVTGDVRWREFLWVNRRNATSSNPGLTVSIRASAGAMEEPDANEWLRGNTSTRLRTPSRGILQGIQKSKGLLGLAVRPQSEKLEMVIGLPV